MVKNKAGGTRSAVVRSTDLFLTRRVEGAKIVVTCRGLLKTRQAVKEK
jgi:hypothetical protein